MRVKSKLCPCGTTLKYAVCCGKYHKGNLQAPTAEALMRARYSAYVLDIPYFIYRTWDEGTRPPLKSLRFKNEKGKEERKEGINEKYMSLEVLATTAGGRKDDQGTVEFIVTFIAEDKQHKHRENSSFCRIKNRWVYTEDLSVSNQNQ